MARKIELDGKEYNISDLSAAGRAAFSSYEFTDGRLRELTNMQALLQRAKNSYVEALKKEILSQKTGIIFD